ncbi:MAG: AAA family ATPase, partial [Candidatus Pacearchaeota archaeon]
MTYIKKLVMYGFKSFVRKTEIPFTPGINVILGPNGSGKSNVSDALCFVLGRLSIKSMRAARAGNLIFLGTKVAAPAKEASVEIVFDNSDKTFSIDNNEISIRRIVRRNGQSIYRINNETKTRQEVLFLLAQGGIDPNGFNIILQGEIQNLVRMHTEDRRKIIEEVSGISIYESRKQKSLKELERTEEKLKEVSAILRERNAYLNNLEKERQQALKFKKLESDVKKFKASIINQDLMRKKKEAEIINSEIEKQNKEIEKTKKIIITIQTTIQNLESQINNINSTIQKSTGLEQEKLNQEIANLRAELAGMNVKFENYERKLYEISKKKQEFEGTIKDSEISIKDLQKESPTIAKKEKEISGKRKELEKIEEQRKKFYTTKTELKSLRERIQDKNSIFQNYKSESDFVLRQIDSISLNIFDSKTDNQKLENLRHSYTAKTNLLEEINKKEIELEKTIHTNEYEIDKQNKLIEKISKIDICPLCKSNITKQHISSIKSEVIPKIDELKKQIELSEKHLNEIYRNREIIKQDIEQINHEISKRESDLISLSNINEKKNQIKTLIEKIEKTKQEISELEKKRKNLEANFDENSNIEQKYETLGMEIQEISLRTKENVNSEISFKQREFERAKITLKQLSREQEDIDDEFLELKKEIEEKEELLEEKKEKEEELSRQFQKLISERNSIQGKIRENELELSRKQNIVYNIEQTTNNLKIEKARHDAEVENFEIEMLEFPNVELIRANKESLLEKLETAKEILSKIGTVNLRSLEVYDEIKKEYDSIQEKVDTISKEKEGIMKIIHEIDIKKKKTFMKTLTELNDIFSRNFSQLSTKGQVSLEVENKKEPFEEGIG